MLRLRALPGEQAQVDWARFGHLHIGRAQRALMAFLMALSYSCRIFLRFFPDTRMGSFMQGHVEAFCAFLGLGKGPAPRQPQERRGRARGRRHAGAARHARSFDRGAQIEAPSHLPALVDLGSITAALLRLLDPFALPAHWSPAQALAVFECIELLREQLWLAFGTDIQRAWRAGLVWPQAALPFDIDEPF